MSRCRHVLATAMGGHWRLNPLAEACFAMRFRVRNRIPGSRATTGAIAALAIATVLFLPCVQAAGSSPGVSELPARSALKAHPHKREAPISEAAAPAPRLRLLAWDAQARAAVGSDTVLSALSGELQRVLPPETDGLRLQHRQRLRSGAEVLGYRAERAGREIFGERITVLLDANGRPRAVSGGALGGSTSRQHAQDPLPTWRIDASAAAGAALMPYGFDPETVARNAIRLPQKGEFAPLRMPPMFAREASGATLGPLLRARPIWLRQAGRLQPAWYVETSVQPDADAGTEYFAHLIHDGTGTVLRRLSLEAHLPVRFQAYADADGLKRPQSGPQGRADHPHPTGLPDGFDPPLAPPGITTLEFAPLQAWWPQSQFADPWLGPGDTTSRGNNVDAYADLEPPDGFSVGDLRASMTSAFAFEPGYRLDLEPDTDAAQISAGVVNAFHLTNYLHDWFYAAGFDEAAGNAQQDNFDRGGEADDVLLVETLDHIGTNNASMITPADGASPKMQLRPFRSPVRAGLRLPDPHPALRVQVAGFGPNEYSRSAPLVRGSDSQGDPRDGCGPLTGNVADRALLLSDGGDCSAVDKARQAQAAGAASLIIAAAGDGYPDLRGEAEDVLIPVLGVSAADAATLDSLLAGSPPLVEAHAQPLPRRDSAMDAAIVAHEWGHYISNRLIGNAAGLSNHQGRALGEGWADFHALLLLTRPEDALIPAGASFAGTYGVMNFVSAGLFPSHSPQSHYFGIRRYPYSTRRTANPLTFGMISAGSALPAGVPRTPATVSSDTSSVHNAGELWASALWDCYASLLRDTLPGPGGATPRLDFFEAQRRMAEYLVAGYKLTPMAPTYTEARDALLVAMAVSDLRDLELCGIAFAGRGMGLRARAPVRQSLALSNIEESYEEGGDLKVDSMELIETAGCDDDDVLDPGERGLLRIRVRNNGTRPLADSSITVSSVSRRIGFPAGNARALVPSDPQQTLTVEFEVALGAGSREAVGFRALPDDPAIPFETGQLGEKDFALSYDIRRFVATHDEFATPELVWTTELDAGLEPELAEWRQEFLDPLTASVRAPDFADPGRSWLISPELDVGTQADFIVEFKARHSFEGHTGEHFDGGVIELSRDGGASWEDIEPLAKMDPDYGGVLSDCCDNPLGGRRAFVGRSEGWPDEFVTHRLDFGRRLAGQQVRLRFGVATDAAVGAPGWTLRSLRAYGIVNTPFPAIVEDAGACTLEGRFSDGFEGDPP